MCDSRSAGLVLRDVTSTDCDLGEDKVAGIIETGSCPSRTDSNNEPLTIRHHHIRSDTKQESQRLWCQCPIGNPFERGMLTLCRSTTSSLRVTTLLLWQATSEDPIQEGGGNDDLEVFA